MKKIFIALLAMTVLFALCLSACTPSTPAESSQEAPQSTEEPASQAEPASEPEPTSEPEPASEAEPASETEPAPEVESSSEPEPESSEPEPESSEPEPEPSEDEPVSEEPSEEEPQELQIAEFISTPSSPYISWYNTPETKSLAHGGIVDTRSANATSVKLTALNEGAQDGLASVIAFNRDYGKTIKSKGGSYDDYAVYLFDYNPDTWHYELTKSYSVGKATSDIKIPGDGFALAIHKYFDSYISAVDSAESAAAFYPHGFRGTNDVDAAIKTAKNITIDGHIDESGWGKAIWNIEASETICSYEQFPKDNYYSNAKVYMAYDSEYLYLGVEVTSPSHICPITAANASTMYMYECIQVNVTTANPMGPYIAEHWDNVIDGTAASANIVRQFGFCVNDNDETLKVVWMGNKLDNSEAVCTRDDANQITTYEVKIPWAECGNDEYKITGKKGEDLGVSVSINSGTAEKQFMNIYLRDGGGIIGLNDWTKVPVITLS